jgi:ABC-type branched-subunit amino acid transport system ATPase component
MHFHYLWTCFMLRTPGSGKTFFIRYLTEYYMLLKKKVILTTTTWCATSRHSSKTSIVRNTFQILCKGYVRPLQELSVEFQILKEVDIIIIDEMSMMTSTLLHYIEIRLRQIENDTNEPYHSKLVIWWAIMHNF